MHSTTDKLAKFAQAAVLILLLFLVNLRSYIFWKMYPDTETLTGLAWLEMLFWLVMTSGMLFLLWRSGQLREYIAYWREQPLLLAWIGLALLSVFWSILWSASLYRGMVLVFSSLGAAYLGFNSRLSDLWRVLFWFGVVVVILSIFLAISVPVIGTDPMPPYNWAWRGIFWHKNHLGSIAALLNLVFLIGLLQRNIPANRLEKLMVFAFYFLSLLVVYFTASAAGYILVLLIHFAIAAALLWLRFSSLMRPVHYYLILGFFLIGAVTILGNLDIVFGWFNRSSNLTGRVPLWEYLLTDVLAKRPWFGHGFGALWAIEAFRIGTSNRLGWTYPVMIGDNGFLDILLHVGIVGAILFLAVYVSAWRQALRHALTTRTLVGFFPLLFMVYTLFANVSYSLFLETESLIWAVMIAILFIKVKPAS